MGRILLIDDEREFRDELSRQLRQAGHDVLSHEEAEEGLRLLGKEPFDLVLLDNKMPRMTGLEFLTTLEERNIDAPPVILMTSAHDADTAIQARMRRAFDYVIKATDFDAILPSMEAEITRALKIGRPLAPVALPRAADKDNKSATGMIGRSRAFLSVLQRIGETEADEPVLILGETGTGKDLVAQAIHTNSTRKKHRFVAINCAAIAPNLLESELFGHEKGAFTGADKMRKGYFEHADGGTLFLDEVGDMPMDLQAKLLRVLQNGEITRMGSCEPIDVDVRVLAATRRDLKILVQRETFREDLFYRLEGTIIRMPPLRDRKEDVELLAVYFLNRIVDAGAAVPTLHPDVLKMLRDHPWPGNIRQLENVIGRARRSVRARRGTQIVAEDLDFGELESSHSVSATAPDTEDGALANFRGAIAWAWQSEQPDLWPLLQSLLERELLRHAIAQEGLSQVQLARRLGIARNTLRARLKQYGLEVAED